MTYDERQKICYNILYTSWSFLHLDLQLACICNIVQPGRQEQYIAADLQYFIKFPVSGKQFSHPRSHLSKHVIKEIRERVQRSPLPPIPLHTGSVLRTADPVAGSGTKPAAGKLAHDSGPERAIAATSGNKCPHGHVVTPISDDLCDRRW